MKLKKKKTVGMVALLIAAVLSVGLLGISCVSGMTPIGWSGGTVSNGTLYVGSLEGRLAAVNLTDNSRQWAEPLKAVVASGLFGCAPSGGGCGGGTSRVAIYGTPVVSDNIVYIAGYNGKIIAYNTNNLATRWVFPREGNLQPFVGALVLAQNKLFIGCSDGWVYALDAATGDKLAEFKTGDKIWGTPAVDGDTLYIGSFDKKLYALSTTDLSPKWDKPFETEGSIIATPLVYNGTVYIGSFDRNLYAVNAADGTPKWKHPYTANNWFWAQPAVINDIIYAGCLDGFIYALKADTGVKITEFDLKNPVASQPVVVDDLIIFASQNGVVYKIASASQEITQIAALKFNVNGPLTAYQGIIYIQTQDYNMQRVDPVNGSLLTPIPLVS